MGALGAVVGVVELVVAVVEAGAVTVVAVVVEVGAVAAAVVVVVASYEVVCSYGLSCTEGLDRKYLAKAFGPTIQTPLC